MVRLFISIAMAVLTACSSGRTSVPYVVLISFDGFRHDYVEKYDAPNFKKFIAEGASADALTPCFPTKTFPNHYSIITGLYPGHHGLLDNRFYDPTRETEYSSHQPDKVQDPYIYGGTPLWQLAQEHGLKSASYFWAGSETPIQGRYPDYYQTYDDKVSDTARVQAVFDWLKRDEVQRPHFISVYFSMTDEAGHDFGPNSVAMKHAVLRADSVLGRLMAGLAQIPLPVDLIVVSDHGMVEMTRDPDTFIIMDDILGPPCDDIHVVNNGTHGYIYLTDPDLTDSVYTAIKKQENHFVVYKRTETPESWHVRNAPRAGDLVLLADAGRYMVLRKQMKDRKGGTWGAHGFAPETPDLGGIFYARGPHIKQGARLPAFENINVYPLVARILNLPTPGIDGDFKAVQNVFVP